MPLRVQRDVPLAPLSTLELGGPAAELVVLDDPRDFPYLVGHARAAGSVPRVIGSGSNILVADEGYPGLVVNMSTNGIVFHNQDSEGEKVLATVQAGHELQALVDATIEEGLSGIELLTGVPGTVGATPIQNVGAYGQEVSESIVEVAAWDWQKDCYTRLSPADCMFGHRTSLFKHSQRWTILSVTFGLTKRNLSPALTYRAVAHAAGVPLGEPAPLAEAAAAVRDVRSKKGMILNGEDPDHRSVGSVFLSPVISHSMADQLRSDGAPVNAFPDGSTRVSASWLIKEADFELGQSVVPGIRISSKHFTLVAHEGATAQGFALGSALVERRVKAATGVQLTAEPDLLGHLPAYEALTGPLDQVI